MKKRWVYLLAMLLVVALTAFGAVAEMAEDAEISFEENVSGILPEDIEMSEDALEIPDDELDVEMQEEEDIQLESLELSELDEPAVTEEAALVDNEEGQTAPGTGESASSSTDDFEIVDGVLVDYKGPGGDVVIPDGVTIIGGEAFYYCKELTSVVIPASVTGIADPPDLSDKKKYIRGGSSDDAGAFGGCSNLASVSLANGLTSIGRRAFQGCTALTNITIPNSVTQIGDGAFLRCSSLSSIYLPASIKEMPWVDGSSAGIFTWCINLIEVTFQDGFTYIPPSMFSGCEKLTTVNIPDSVVSIGKVAFRDCYNLRNIVLPESITNIAWGTFYDCDSLVSVSLPARLKTIEDNAFNGCGNLESISLPSGIKSIGKDAFAGCNKLLLTISATETTIGKHAFENVNVPRITVEEGVKIIDEYAFYGCSSMKEIALPDSLTEIREGAFEQCGIIEISIPQNVKKLGVAAFFDCRQLKTITFGSRLTAVGREAFFGCRKLTTIIISENMTDISDGMFKECEGITKIDIPETVGIIGNSAFESCSGLTSAIIGSAVNGGSSNGLASNAARAKKIVVGTKAFLGCGNMKKIVIPANVTKIADDAFDGCLRLTIYGEKGSYAQQYAKEHDIPFKAVKLNTPPTGIAIDQGKKTTLYMGNKLKLTAKIEPAGATTTVTWKSSKPTVAAVSSKGVVTPKKAGTAVITARTANGLTKRITIKVVDASGVKLKEGKSRTLKVGKKLTLHATVSPKKVKTKLTWTSSDKKVATVSTKGVVTAKRAGTAVITVRTANGKRATIKISVK